MDGREKAVCGLMINLEKSYKEYCMVEEHCMVKEADYKIDDDRMVFKYKLWDAKLILGRRDSYSTDSYDIFYGCRIMQNTIDKEKINY